MTTTRLDPTPAAEAAHATELGPVLVAVGARRAEGALRAGRALAEHLGTRMLVVSALEAEPAYVATASLGPVPPELEQARIERRREAVEAAMHDALGAGVEPPLEVRLGDPATVIAAAARAHDASYVVAGIGRHDVAARLLAGETALRIVRRAGRPVLAVPMNAVLPARVAVAALDFSIPSVAAARAALPLLAPDATLHLVHAWTRSSGSDEWLRERDEAYEKSLPELLERVRQALGAPPSVTVVTAVEQGTPVDALLAYAERVEADLLSAGRRSHGFLERLLMGSVATSLLRRAQCAVLLAPEPPAAAAEELARRVSGTYECRAPEAWAAQLAGFTRRNAGRRTRLEVDDPRLGAQAQETGYVLLGATYDPRDGRAELMLGEQGGGAHFTRTIPRVSAIGVLCDREGRDVALRIMHGQAQTLLTFLSDEGE